MTGVTEERETADEIIDHQLMEEGQAAHLFIIPQKSILGLDWNWYLFVNELYELKNHEY